MSEIHGADDGNNSDDDDIANNSLWIPEGKWIFTSSLKKH